MGDGSWKESMGLGGRDEGFQGSLRTKNSPLGENMIQLYKYLTKPGYMQVFAAKKRDGSKKNIYALRETVQWRSSKQMDVLDECIVEIMECSLQNSRERDYKGSGEQQRYPYQLSLKVSIPHSVCTKEKMRQSPVDKAIGWDFPSSLCTCFSKCMHIKCCLVEVRVYGLIWQGGAQPTCLRLVSCESLATDISLFQKVQCSP